MRFLLLALVMVAVPAAMRAQVDVYSEFRRPGPDGAIVKQDRAGTPREILSPAVARNGSASVFVVVNAAPGAKVTLYVGSNPEGMIQGTIYRAVMDSNGVPDVLEKVTPPFYDVLPNGVGVFLVDMFVPQLTPVRRVRFEIQFHDGDKWVIYPMEVRVVPATVPKLMLTSGALAPIAANSATTAIEPLRGFVCGKTERVTLTDTNVRSMIRRNASQDAALARMLEGQIGREAAMAGVMKAIGAESAEQWCGSRRPPEDPELYLRVRDYLLRTVDPK
ncbi:MAG: hypothetical protein U0Q16_24040 [Bryobacteraceae bacterium]